MMSEWRPDAPLESPSGLMGPDTPEGVALTDEDIADIISAFGHSARMAKELGFDALELHGAHGYLIDQFFWSGTNQRTDRFGGRSITERAKFAADVLRAVRAEIGDDLVMILRISQFKIQDFSAKIAETPAELEEWLTPLSDAGVDIFHCSQRRFWEPEFEDSELNLAGWVKKVTGRATISVGSVGLNGDFLAGAAEPQDLDALRERIARREFDLVAVGRALLGDPEWAQKVRAQQFDELRPFSPDSLGVLA